MSLVKRRNLNHVLVALELEGYVKRPAASVQRWLQIPLHIWNVEYHLKLAHVKSYL